MTQYCFNLFFLLRRRLRIIACGKDFIVFKLFKILHVVLVVWNATAPTGHAELVVGYAHAFLLLGSRAIIRV